MIWVKVCVYRCKIILPIDHKPIKSKPKPNQYCNLLISKSQKLRRSPTQSVGVPCQTAMDATNSAAIIGSNQRILAFFISLRYFHHMTGAPTVVRLLNVGALGTTPPQVPYVSYAGAFFHLFTFDVASWIPQPKSLLVALLGRMVGFVFESKACVLSLVPRRWVNSCLE